MLAFGTICEIDLRRTDDSSARQLRAAGETQDDADALAATARFVTANYQRWKLPLTWSMPSM